MLSGRRSTAFQSSTSFRTRSAGSGETSPFRTPARACSSKPDSREGPPPASDATFPICGFIAATRQATWDPSECPMTSTRLRSIDGNDSAVRSAAEIASDQRSMVYSRRNSSEDPIDKPGRWASCPNTVPGFSTTRIRARSSKTSRNTRCPSKTRSPRRKKFESAPEPRINTISGSRRLSRGSGVMKNRISRRNRSRMLKPSYGIFPNRGSRFGAGRFVACATAGASNSVRRVSLVHVPAETEGAGAVIALC